MGLHWTYHDNVDAPDLQQGDLLKRTAELEGLLRSYYPLYAAKEENRHFLVLTQTCDLVRRENNRCATRYIAIAPVRPLQVALQRKLSELTQVEVAEAVPIYTRQAETKLRQWLERLLNNNEAAYFYLRRQPDKELPDDSCAFLALSIAIKSELHYETCLRSRCLTLDEIFRAKLGWLVGQMYSALARKIGLGMKWTLRLRRLFVMLQSGFTRRIRNHFKG